jgi:DNA-binding transcriptional LysR family regulator
LTERVLNLLTQAGEQLVKHAKSIFEIYREIDFEMSALIKEQYGTLRLGLVPLFAIYNSAISLFSGDAGCKVIFEMETQNRLKMPY